MASTGRTQVIRAFTVLALTGAAVAVPAMSAEAVAAPSTCEQTRAQFTANGQAAEKVAEQLNDAKIAKAKAQNQVAAAAVKARSAGATYGEAARDFKRIVSGELKSAPAGQFAVFFTSGSPKEFADQMALMDYVAGRKGQRIDQLAGIRGTALKAQRDVQATLAARTKIEQTMTALSALSRTTSSSNSFQPRTDSSTSTDFTGDSQPFRRAGHLPGVDRHVDCRYRNAEVHGVLRSPLAGSFLLGAIGDLVDEIEIWLAALPTSRCTSLART